MEEELKQLKEMLTQLRAENQSLREERRDSQSHSSHAVSDGRVSLLLCTAFTMYRYFESHILPLYLTLTLTQPLPYP